MRNIDYFLKNGWLLGHECGPAVDHVPASSKVDSYARHVVHSRAERYFVFYFLVGVVSVDGP